MPQAKQTRAKGDGRTIYVVQNPRHMPEGRHVLSLKTGERFTEGDDFTPPQGCDLQRLLDDGFLTLKKKEVAGG